MQLFGFKFFESTEKPVSFAAKETDDGAIVVTNGMGAGFYSYQYERDTNTTSEAELITRYRQLSLEPEIESAIDEIVNEAIASDEIDIVKLNTDKLEEYTEKFRDIIRQEFDEIVKLYDFNAAGYELFRRWYIDGQIKFHVIIDENDPSSGIKEIRYIDPRKIRKVRFVDRKKGEAGAILVQDKDEYYVYNENGFDSKNTKNNVNTTTTMTGLKIAAESIVHVTSGLIDDEAPVVLSYLHKALRVFNQLRSLEDATVIYRLSRAPERRVFYIDVGGLPTAKAEQYLKEVQTRYRNRLVYNSATGEIKDDRRHMTMLEDFWLPRRDGRSTEITTLPAGQQLGEMGDVDYFKEKLYRSLNVPASRLDQGAMLNLGRQSEITRDELKFSKFITRLRLRFSDIFLQALKKNLILKNIISVEEWANIRNGIYVDFAVDSHILESKRLDILGGRLEILAIAKDYEGTYFSRAYIVKNILNLTEEEWEQMQEEIKEEQEQETINMQNQQAMQNGQTPSDDGMADAMQGAYDEPEQYSPDEMMGTSQTQDLGPPGREIPRYSPDEIMGNASKKNSLIS